jgi:hypothetical protein
VRLLSGCSGRAILVECPPPHLLVVMRRCYDAAMRTTLDLDDDVLAAARSLAAAEGASLGRVVSDLARRGLMPPRAGLGDATDDDPPRFDLAPGSPPVTPNMVRSALEDE